MGSAATYHLANRGHKVLALERFNLNHSYGSSHGRTRIIRAAYFKHDSYVPLVRGAYELWRELQNETGMTLMMITGGLTIGGRTSQPVSGSLASARTYKIPHELLSSRELRERFEIFAPSENDVGVFEPGAGMLLPERCIEAHCNLATKAGAEFHFNETVESWTSENYEIRIKTNRAEYETEKLVLTCGPWTPSLLRDLHLPLKCERQVPIWFEPPARSDICAPSKMPVFIWELPSGQSFYGIPDNGDGVKVARHHGGESVMPDEVDQRVREDDEIPVRKFLRDHLPLLNGQIRSSTTCIYTNTPDEDFIIDFHPRTQNVLIVSACSGHGFKFSSSIGEVVSSLVAEGRTKFDIQKFSLKRFQAK